MHYSDQTKLQYTAAKTTVTVMLSTCAFPFPVPINWTDAQGLSSFPIKQLRGEDSGGGGGGGGDISHVRYLM
jgi:hypothetical protein